MLETTSRLIITNMPHPDVTFTSALLDFCKAVYVRNKAISKIRSTPG